MGFFNRPYVDVGINVSDADFNNERNVVGWFADFGVECMSTKSCVVWWEENKVYNRVGIAWVICKPSGARV